MDKKLTFRYDKDSDTLYFIQCPPYPEQETEELDYGVIARTNPQTDEIEYLEILFWSQRLEQTPVLKLPLRVNGQPVLEMLV